MSDKPTEGDKPAPFWTPDDDLPATEVVDDEPVTAVHEAVVDVEPEPEATPEPEAVPEPETPAAAAPPEPPAPDPAPPISSSPSSSIDEHPERVVLGAFAGGLVLASILRRLGS